MDFVVKYTKNKIFLSYTFTIIALTGVVFLFGYIKTYNDELKVIELKQYNAVYCGLCKELGKSFNQVMRLSLNYDFTFLSLFMIATDKNDFKVRGEGCVANAFQKKPVVKDNPSLAFCCDVAAITLYHKILDNINDSKTFKKFLYTLARLFFFFSKRKAEKRIPHVAEYIKNQMLTQSSIEILGTNSFDEAAMPSANSMEYIFSEIAKRNKCSDDKSIYKYLGFYLGKWIYFMDAADDYFDDIKDNSYNVFAKKFGKSLSIKQLKEKTFPVLNSAKSEIINAYNLLSIEKFKPILDNILFLGLKYMQEFIFLNKNIQTNKKINAKDIPLKQ